MGRQQQQGTAVICEIELNQMNLSRSAGQKERRNVASSRLENAQNGDDRSSIGGVTREIGVVHALGYRLQYVAVYSGTGAGTGYWYWKLVLETGTGYWYIVLVHRTGIVVLYILIPVLACT